MLALNISEQAAADVVRAYEYLHDQASDAVAERFVARVDRTLSGLRRFPLMGRVYHVAGMNDTLRCWRIDGFDAFRVFYRLSDRSIDIVRIEHGARDLIAILHQGE